MDSPIRPKVITNTVAGRLASIKPTFRAHSGDEYYHKLTKSGSKVHDEKKSNVELFAQKDSKDRCDK